VGLINSTEVDTCMTVVEAAAAAPDRPKGRAS